MSLTALQFAKRAHAGQLRKGLPEPYVEHPIRVAFMAVEMGMTRDAIDAALLHDVVEDCDVTLGQLLDAGFSRRTVELVGLLTKTYGDHAPADVKAREKPKYYARIQQDADAVTLKLLDRIDNLRDMTRLMQDPVHGPKKRKWAVNYLLKTSNEFVPLLQGPLLPPLRTWFVEAFGATEKALLTVPVDI